MDIWLRELIEGKFGKFSSKVLFVIAGRYSLSQAWTRFRGAIRQLELHEFSEAEARDYIQKSGITNEKEIAQLIQLSNHLPVLLALLVSAPGKTPTDVSSTAVDRFLQGTTTEEKEASLATSLPRFFNQDVLSVILDPKTVDDSFNWLSNAHFVHAGTNGWSYHEVVRSMMLRYFRLRSNQRYIKMHGKLAEYYHSLADSLGISEDKKQQDKIWRKYETEYLYHFLSQNPSKLLEEAFEVFLNNLSNNNMLTDIETIITTQSRTNVLS